MPVFHVEASDPRLELYRGVSDAALLKSHGLFVAEGRFVVERALEAGCDVASALLNDAALAALGPLFATRTPDVPILHCPAGAFRDITGFDIHRGCLALVRRPAPVDWREAVGRVRRVVVLEAVANADNVGGVFRSAAAFGAAVLLGPSCCDPLYRKAVRTSMGTVLRVAHAPIEPWPEAIRALRDRGFIVAALSPRAPTPLAAFAAATAGRRLALVVGGEGAGLTDAAVDAADVRIGIPMRGGVDSLNLAVAAGIALARCAEAAGDGEPD